jgi:hypothetical protein
MPLPAYEHQFMQNASGNRMNATPAAPAGVWLAQDRSLDAGMAKV